MKSERGRHGPVHHAAAGVLALSALPYAHKALHIAADGYAFAWTAFAITAALYSRKHTMPRLVLAWLTLLAAVTDLPVMRDTITELTGARW